MVDSVNSNINIKLKGTDIQLNANTMKGTVLDKKAPIFMKDFDKNGDGVISEKEAKTMLKQLQKAAGDDTLTAKELEKAGLGNKEDFNAVGSAVQKKTGTTVETDNDGQKVTTVRNEDGTITKTIDNSQKKTKTVQNFDANGNIISRTTQTPKSSVTASFKYDENGNLISSKYINRDAKGKVSSSVNNTLTYDEAGNKIGQKTVRMDKSGKPTEIRNIRYENNSDGNVIKATETITDGAGSIKATVATDKKYRADGRTLESVTQNVTNKDGSTAHTEQTHNKQGRLTTKHTVTKDKSGNITSDLTSKYEYAKDGRTIQKSVVTGTREGKPYSRNEKYNQNGKLESMDESYYKHGAKFNDYYEGTNLNNRRGYIPSQSTEYEADGKTIKSITTNKFNKDGVLISEEIKDKNGKVISTHDFSKIDGKIDTSYQKGRGDCYLLAGVNALNASSAGQKVLKNAITTGKDPKTGETTYTVTFPGAKETREKLIKMGVPEDQINIKTSYTYTESEIHEKAKEAGKKYSAGDKDVLLLEVAYEDMRTDAASDIKNLKMPKINTWKALTDLHLRGLETNSEDTLRGGKGSDVIFMLTGKKSWEYSTAIKNDTAAPVCSIDSDLNITLVGDSLQITKQQSAKLDSMLNQIEQDYKKDGKVDNYAGCVSLLVSNQTVNGQELKGAGHAFSISRVDGDNVYLRNPWDSSKEICMTRDELKKATYMVSVTPLDGSVNNSRTVQDNGNGGGTNISQSVPRSKRRINQNFKKDIIRQLTGRDTETSQITGMTRQNPATPQSTSTRKRTKSISREELIAKLKNGKTDKSQIQKTYGKNSAAARKAIIEYFKNQSQIS